MFEKFSIVDSDLPRIYLRVYVKFVRWIVWFKSLFGTYTAVYLTDTQTR